MDATPSPSSHTQAAVPPKNRRRLKAILAIMTAIIAIPVVLLSFVANQEKKEIAERTRTGMARYLSIVSAYPEKSALEAEFDKSRLMSARFNNYGEEYFGVFRQSGGLEHFLENWQVITGRGPNHRFLGHIYFDKSNHLTTYTVCAQSAPMVTFVRP